MDTDYQVMAVQTRITTIHEKQKKKRGRNGAYGPPLDCTRTSTAMDVSGVNRVSFGSITGVVARSLPLLFPYSSSSLHQSSKIINTQSKEHCFCKNQPINKILNLCLLLGIENCRPVVAFYLYHGSDEVRADGDILQSQPTCRYQPHATLCHALRVNTCRDRGEFRTGNRSTGGILRGYSQRNGRGIGTPLRRLSFQQWQRARCLQPVQPVERDGLHGLPELLVRHGYADVSGTHAAADGFRLAGTGRHRGNRLIAHRRPGIPHPLLRR